MSVAPDTTQPRTSQARVVTGGVDTRQPTHHAAVLDSEQRQVADQGVPSHRSRLPRPAGLDGRPRADRGRGGGVDGLLRCRADPTPARRRDRGSRGRPPRKATRVKQGKSDPIDAYSAARQAQSGTAMGKPKITAGIIEAIRVLKVPRDAAVKDRTRAYCQLRDLITTAPAPIHDELIVLTGHQRARRAATYRPDPTRIHEPTHAAKQALRSLARRIGALDIEIAAADQVLGPADQARGAQPARDAPGRNPDRGPAGHHRRREHRPDAHRSHLRQAPSVSHPLPASSGKTRRHRLNRGGDRHANSALYMIVVGRIPQPPRHQGIRTTPPGRRTQQPRDHPLPQETPRPQHLPRPAKRPPHHLTTYRTVLVSRGWEGPTRRASFVGDFQHRVAGLRGSAVAGLAPQPPWARPHGG